MKKTSGIKKEIQSQKVKIAIVWSRFNDGITHGLLKGAARGLKEAGLGQSDIHIFETPGAFEIPLLAQKIAQTSNYQGVICLGAVIRGETAHFDYVCEGVTQGIMSAQLKTEIPMAFGILTTDTIKQAQARSGEDDQNKGYEASKVILEMVQTLRSVISS
ncbi:MAG: 6,7-dimethyl-8-ribityllumazine synthase [Deltaproteobacteria bacterium]|nr:6,7-dimethyl-8-ribityllumazine synthase [Deltaproteobacteria bacterium]